MGEYQDEKLLMILGRALVEKMEELIEENIELKKENIKLKKLLSKEQPYCDYDSKDSKEE